MSENIEFILLVNIKYDSVLINLVSPVKEIAEKSVINLDDLLLQVKYKNNINNYNNIDELKCNIKSYIELRLPLGSYIKIDDAYDKINTKFIDKSFRDEIVNKDNKKFFVKWIERIEYVDTYLTNNNSFNFN